MSAYYVQPHVSQFDGSARQGEHCTQAAVANGVAAQSGGRFRPTVAYVSGKVAKWEETSPSIPGWSTADAAKACLRMDVPFSNMIGLGWQRLLAERGRGRGIILGGDSDQFSNATCSGAFDGDHRIFIHPATLGTRWWIDDPICKVGRWEEAAVLLRYARDFNSLIDFGVFLTPVPNVSDTGYRYHIKRRSVVRVYAMSTPPTSVSKGRITGWEDVTWGPRDSSAPCGPIRQAVYKGTTVNVTKVTAGKFANQWCRVGAVYGTTVTDT